MSPLLFGRTEMDGLKAAREAIWDEPSKPARKTAAEKRAEEVVARETQRLREQEEALAAWPERLMKNLERSSKQYWDIAVQNNRFVVAAKDSWGDLDEQRFGLIPTGRFEMWNQDNDWYAMDELERMLDHAEAEQREQERKAAIRQGAIAKLTKEEREELGL